MAIVFLLAVAPFAAQAQWAEQEQDPPARVGRLAYASGTVSLRLAGEGQWSQAAVNEPLAAGSGVWTEPDSHAVVEIGPAELRLAGGTELELDRVDLGKAELRLPQGSVDLRLSALPEGDSFQLATPRGTVTLLRPGLYRIDAGTAAQPTEIAAFDGSASFQAAGSSIAVPPGQAATVSGTTNLAYDIHPAVRTAIDNWAAAQDARLARGEAAHYLSPEATGYQDLDQYGTWQATPEYGAVWYPTAVPVGWVPYRYGHWAWVAPGGWTWIDDTPWGFTPFHYGRWVFWRERWVWVPGRYRARPVYAPALVAFVGGSTLSVAVAAGTVPAVGWVPLGPEEVFVPSYRASPRYLREVNIANVREVAIDRVASVDATRGGMARAAEMTRSRDPEFANRRAATIVRREDFVSARPVHASAVAVQPGALKLAAFDPKAVPRPPPRDSAALAGRAGSRAAPRPHGIRAIPLAATERHAPASLTAAPPSANHARRRSITQAVAAVPPHEARHREARQRRPVTRVEPARRVRERPDRAHHVASLPPERRPRPERVPEHRPAAVRVEHRAQVQHAPVRPVQGVTRPAPIALAPRNPQ